MDDLERALRAALDAIDSACRASRPLPYGPIRTRLADAQIAVHDAWRNYTSASTSTPSSARALS